jgi:hypothetical protein
MKESLVKRFSVAGFALLALCAISAAFPNFGAIAQNSPVVGRIDGVSGNVSHIAVVRGGRRVENPVALFGAVEAGDVFSVATHGTEVTLRFVNRQRVVVAYGNSPYTVPSFQQRSTISDAALRTVSSGISLIQGANTDKVQALGRTGGGLPEENCAPNFLTTDRPLRVPLLEGADVRLSTGAALGFQLSWLGGEAPFDLTVEAIGGARRAAIKVQVRCVDWRSLALEEGQYRVLIVDNNQRRFERSISVVPAAIVPSNAAFRAGSDSDFEVTLVRAYWLAGESDGDWALEAFRALSTLADSQSATVIRNALAAGTFSAAPRLRR